MGMINWIFDIYQHTQIDKAREESAQARAEMAAMRSSSGSGIDNQKLERALGELALATKTIQRLMVEKGLCDQSEFRERLKQIDLEDGTADGRAPI